MFEKCCKRSSGKMLEGWRRQIYIFLTIKIVCSVEVLAEGFYTITDGFKLKGVQFIKCFFFPCFKFACLFLLL